MVMVVALITLNDEWCWGKDYLLTVGVGRDCVLVLEREGDSLIIRLVVALVVADGARAVVNNVFKCS